MQLKKQLLFCTLCLSQFSNRMKKLSILFFLVLVDSFSSYSLLIVFKAVQRFCHCSLTQFYSAMRGEKKKRIKKKISFQMPFEEPQQNLSFAFYTQSNFLYKRQIIIKKNPPRQSQWGKE